VTNALATPADSEFQDMPSLPPRADQPIKESNAGERHRLFVAVRAPVEVREYASRVVGPLRPYGDVRWVPSDRLHLTLKFLGATPIDLIPDVCESLSKTANVFSSFVVELPSIGAFPDAHRPRTVWLGIEPPEQVSKLAMEIDRAAGRLGFEREQKPYRAHLTLGRVKSPRGIGALATALDRANRSIGEPVQWRIRRMELIRSNLHPSGPEYTTVQRFLLRQEE